MAVLQLRQISARCLREASRECRTFVAERRDGANQPERLNISVAEAPPA